ncbi:pH-dependent sodium/proton antiporter [Vibrio cincinnatiensis]|uniref:Na(+)/H(+) antiporter NhaA n=1 Tax=Vibrio cincinnatiensis DSM 19608 TaxID=1123491 RepID=A0A1T4KCB0_VIBCI|nr:Na+/H+ antiporter NhaA [Vibrio cincinnatiensis]SJZ40088.1 Na+:H+ antiporter, NhaA family [Vibrio cincinnatiensis DSM 19608]SUP48683.1 pH-dependent sodium/proton antiporter [Vibrio cincinnatiensis]
MYKRIKYFLTSDPASGILLLLAAITALTIANSPLQASYQSLLNFYLFGISVSHWINDGLMALFFLMIGLEVKRELIEGSLNSRSKAMLPAIAGLGGMLFPIIIFLFFNYKDPIAINGWAAPAATDIAFALAILSLLGKRVPVELKVFLLALAIIDDLGVIFIIAIFYNSEPSGMMLLFVLTISLFLFFCGKKQFSSLALYFVLFIVLWFTVYHSGIHATLAGVIAGFLIPQTCRAGKSPAKRVEHLLNPYVAFCILPLFAFANSGVTFSSIQAISDYSHLPLGIALGLFVGKPIGVFLFSWLAIKLGIAQLPQQVNMRMILAVAVLCGIGFTMSIFISTLAFPAEQSVMVDYTKIGILMGSSASALLGFSMLSRALPSVVAQEVPASSLTNTKLQQSRLE